MSTVLAGWLPFVLRFLTQARSRRYSVLSAKWQMVDEILARYNFAPESQRWLRSNVYLKIDRPQEKSGGGYWRWWLREVHLFTGQHEAAVHELAHAWWHYRRKHLRDAFIEAVVRLSAEGDAHYSELAQLAYGYVHGIPAQNWDGLLKRRNDHEMFAGLASGTMGEISKLPPYVRQFYNGLFSMPQDG